MRQKIGDFFYYNDWPMYVLSVLLLLIGLTFLLAVFGSIPHAPNTSELQATIQAMQTLIAR